MPRHSASHAPVTRTHSGSLRERGAPGGERNGESVSIEQAVRGDERRHLGRALLAPSEHEAGEADGQTEVDDRATVVGRTRVRVDDGGRPVAERLGPAGLPHPGAAKLLEQGVLGVALPIGRAAVEDRGLAGREREGEVPAQVDELVGDRAEHAVVVETGLADRDDAVVGGAGREGRPRRIVDLGGVVRMDADGRIQPREAVDERERALGRGDVPARDEDPLDARQARAADHEVRVALEAVGVEMAMAVDQAHPGMVGATAEGRVERLSRRSPRRRAAGRAARGP